MAQTFVSKRCGVATPSFVDGDTMWVRRSLSHQQKFFAKTHPPSLLLVDPASFLWAVWWLPPSLSTRTATHIHTAPRNWHVPYVTNHLTTKHAKIKTPTKTTPTTTNENWEHTLHVMISTLCTSLIRHNHLLFDHPIYIYSPNSTLP